MIKYLLKRNIVNFHFWEDGVHSPFFILSAKHNWKQLFKKEVKKVERKRQISSVVQDPRWHSGGLFEYSIALYISDLQLKKWAIWTCQRTKTKKESSSKNPALSSQRMRKQPMKMEYFKTITTLCQPNAPEKTVAPPTLMPAKAKWGT